MHTGPNIAKLFVEEHNVKSHRNQFRPGRHDTAAVTRRVGALSDGAPLAVLRQGVPDCTGMPQLGSQRAMPLTLTDLPVSATPQRRAAPRRPRRVSLRQPGRGGAGAGAGAWGGTLRWSDFVRVGVVAGSCVRADRPVSMSPGADGGP